MELKTLDEFWALVKEVWQDGVYGIDVGHFLVALGIFLVFIIFRGLFSRFILTQIRFLSSKSKTTIDDQVVNALAEPVRFIPVVLGVFFASSFLEVSEDVASFFSKLDRSLVAFVIFWALHRIAAPLGDTLERADNFLTVEMVRWLVRILRVGFIIIGAAAVLEIWGIEVGPLVAGLGLFGVAVALGAQDLFKNLIAGIFVIGEKRFHVGDWVFVDGLVQGTVEEIGFRTTMIRRFDKAPVYVPNAQLADSVVTNFTRMTHRRIKWLIGVEYRTTHEQLIQIVDEIKSYIENNEAFAGPPDVPLFVRVDAFNASSIDILLYCFTNTTVWGEWLEEKEKLALKVKEIVEGAGTGFAFPSQSLYVESFPKDMEVFPLQQQEAPPADSAAD